MSEVDLEQLEGEAFPPNHPVSFRELRRAAYWMKWRTRAAAAGGDDTAEAGGEFESVLDHLETCELCQTRRSVIEASDPEWNEKIRGSVAQAALVVELNESKAPDAAANMAMGASAALVTAAVITALAKP